MADETSRKSGASMPHGTDENPPAYRGNSGKSAEHKDDSKEERAERNPAHTTTGNVTSPKFGSAGSGGAEFEPGPEKD